MLHDLPGSAAAARSPDAGPKSGPASTLVRGLRRLGVVPFLQSGACGYTVPGVGISMSVRQLDDCTTTRRREMARLRALLFERCAVTLSLFDADCGTARQLERVLRQLQRASSAPCIDRRRLGLVLPGQSMPLPAYLLMSRVWLGNGPRYVLLDEMQCPGTRNVPERAVFSTLYQQRIRQRALSPVYGGSLRSRCALLPDERGVAINAPLAVLAPANSAWLPLSLNLCRFSDSRGRLCEPELFATLRQALRLADLLYDRLYWGDACQRHDARCNRRIALLVRGTGDLVKLRRDNPSTLECLRSLDRLFAGIHQCLWDESQRLAKERGLLPALAARDPSHKLRDSSARQRWQRRWQDALAHAAVRHRNLLTLSPYELLPQSGASSAAFADLLPLLSYADALCFAGRPSFAHWRIEEFRAFHDRAAAVLRRRNAVTSIASGV